MNLKLQYFGHLMRRTDSFEMSVMLGKIEGQRSSVHLIFQARVLEWGAIVFSNNTRNDSFTLDISILPFEKEAVINKYQGKYLLSAN